MLNPMSTRYPADLPITARREEMVAAIRGNWVLDLATETCSEGLQRDRHFIFYNPDRQNIKTHLLKSLMLLRMSVRPILSKTKANPLSYRSQEAI